VKIVLLTAGIQRRVVLILRQLRILIRAGIVVGEPEEEKVLCGCVPVEAHIERVIFPDLRLLKEVVPNQAVRACGQREGVQVIYGNWIQAIFWDDVSLKWSASQWVEDFPFAAGSRVNAVEFG
jgi:hypothetical protein